MPICKRGHKYIYKTDCKQCHALREQKHRQRVRAIEQARRALVHDDVVRARLRERVKIDASGCWFWVGSHYSNGYGRMSVDGKEQLAHRLSYQYFIGPIPDGMQVLHNCDVGACINPKHLHIGTHRDNMQEAWDRGRHSTLNGIRAMQERNRQRARL